MHDFPLMTLLHDNGSDGSNNWDANIANAVMLLTPVAPRGGGSKVVTSAWVELDDMFLV